MHACVCVCVCVYVYVCACVHAYTLYVRERPTSKAHSSGDETFNM